MRHTVGSRLGCGRALGVGLVGLAAALIALVLADARLRAEPASRDDGRIAFTFGESGADRPAQLAVMDGDGENRRALPPFDVNSLTWSPDGRFIAYDWARDIYKIDVERRRSRPRKIHSGANPAWSPDGRTIAFVRGGDIWTVDLNGRRQRLLVRRGDSPSWAPGGRKLAFERGRDVWVFAAKKERRLVRNGHDAQWSADGRRIAFDRCRTPGECFIYVMRSDGTKQRRLSLDGEYPTWSPNGQELAFEGPDARRGYQDAIIRARLDGSGRRVLFGETPYCGCGSIHWARAPRSRR
jgi:Tol biopolymer transport system component